MSLSIRPGTKARTLRYLLAAAALLAAACAYAVSSIPEAKAAKVTVILGNTPNTPFAQCPEDCQAVASSTAYQVSVPGVSNPFEVEDKGKLTKWSITLGSPTNRQRSSFNAKFGGPPQAGIAVLKLLTEKNGAPKYYLKAKSKIKPLGKYFGKRVSFGLPNIPVNPGDVVALVVPTWAPAYGAIDLDSSNARKFVWRSSIPSSMCNPSRYAESWNPQVKIGSKRVYGCKFSAAQLLYTATLVTQG